MRTKYYTNNTSCAIGQITRFKYVSNRYIIKRTISVQEELELSSVYDSILRDLAAKASNQLNLNQTQWGSSSNVKNQQAQSNSLFSGLAGIANNFSNLFFYQNSKPNKPNKPNGPKR